MPPLVILWLTIAIIIAIVYIILCVAVSEEYLTKNTARYGNTPQRRLDDDKVVGAVMIGLVIAFGWPLSLPILTCIGIGMIVKKKYSKRIIAFYTNTFVEEK